MSAMKALALVESPEHVCCRYRVGAFAPALARAGVGLELLGLSGRGAGGRWEAWKAAKGADVVLLQRKLLPTWQVALLRSRARRLIFDFDDAVIYRDSNDPRGPHCRRRSARFAATVRAADVVLAGNRFLADLAIEAGAAAKKVEVLPTCVRTNVPIRIAPGPAGRLVLAWIGSSSTLKGLERERSLWEQVGRELPGVVLRVVCDRFPDFGPLPIERIPWSEAAEGEALATADAGISHIPDDLWSRGKCGLKLLQYQAAALPVVANPVGVHPEMIVPGVSGFLPTNPMAWLATLRVLRDDPALRHRMGVAGRASVKQNYSIAAGSPTFVRALAPGAASPSHEVPPAPRGLKTAPAARRSGALKP